MSEENEQEGVPSNLNGHRELRQPASEEMSAAAKVLKLLKKIASNSADPYQRAYRFTFPFLVNGGDLTSLDDDIARHLQSIPDAGQTEFIAVARARDGDLQRYSAFAEFLEKSSKRKELAFAQMTWSRFNIGDNGEPISGSVRITFRTQKRFPEERKNPEILVESSVDLEVSGSTHNWVNNTFDDLYPTLEEMAHGGILRPLWYFSNPYVVQLAALAGGWVALVWESAIVNRWLAQAPQLALKQVRDKILVAETAENKLDLLINWWLTPENSSATQDIGRVMAGMVTFFAAFIILRFTLPLLTPSASIAIGIGHKRAITYMDGFKIIVFGVLVSAIIIPLILSLV